MCTSVEYVLQKYAACCNEFLDCVHGYQIPCRRQLTKSRSRSPRMHEYNKKHFPTPSSFSKDFELCSCLLSFGIVLQTMAGTTAVYERVEWSRMALMLFIRCVCVRVRVRVCGDLRVELICSQFVAIEGF